MPDVKASASARPKATLFNPSPLQSGQNNLCKNRQPQFPKSRLGLSVNF